MKNIFKLLILLPGFYLNAYAAEPDTSSALTLTPTGLHGITKTTPFEIAKIQALFPHTEVQLAKAMTEGMEYKIMVVAKNNEPLFTLLPTAEKKTPEHVLCLATDSSHIINSLGVKVGDSYQTVYQGKKAPNCIPGIEEMSGQAICSAKGADNIYYVFYGKWDGVDGTVPPADIINQWKVKDIIWLADPSKKDLLAQYCRSAKPMQTKAENGGSELASEKVEAHDVGLDAPLLKKLKNKSPLTLQDKARLEVIYQAKYVGEEQLTSVQEQIYKYAKNILSPATQKMIEQKADAQGM